MPTLDEIATQLSGKPMEVRKLEEMLARALADIDEANRRARAIQFALQSINLLHIGSGETDAHR